MIITLAGRPGSGKSVVAAQLAARLGFAQVSAGDFMRDMATERGLSILELSRSAESRRDIDEEIDARTVRYAEANDDFVMDARLGWHFIPDSVKVFLDVRPEVAAARIYGADRNTEHENVDLATTLEAMAARAESEVARYRAYYGLNHLDPSHYDLVIDTSDRDIDNVVDLIVEHLAPTTA